MPAIGCKSRRDHAHRADRLKIAPIFAPAAALSAFPAGAHRNGVAPPTPCQDGHVSVPAARTDVLSDGSSLGVAHEGHVIASPEEDDASAAHAPVNVSVKPWVEALLVGGLTPILLVASFALRKVVPLDPVEYAVGFLMFHAAFVINDPHFAVTYLLFYEDMRGRALGQTFPPGLRVRYVLAGFVAPVAMVLWAAVAIHRRDAQALGQLLQLMFFLVGFHYVKQGFGLFTLLAQRRGARLRQRERWAVLAHCYAGWFYAYANPPDPGTLVEEKGLVSTSWAHAPMLEQIALATLLASCVPLVAVFVARALRHRKATSATDRLAEAPLLVPLLALLCSIWPWSIYSSRDPLVIYMIPALHSVQYLYIVWLLKHTEGRRREIAPHFERSARARVGLLVVSSLALGFVLFHGAPTVLDDLLVDRKMRATNLGPTPYFAAIFAIVNLHHYFMDWVLWRRENPKMAFLRHLPVTSSPAGESPGGSSAGNT